MPIAPVASSAIIELDSTIDALQTLINRAVDQHLPPWVVMQPFQDRSRAVKAARLIFHRVLADLLAWTPLSQKSGASVTFVWRRSTPEGDYQTTLDPLVLAILNCWDIEDECRREWDLGVFQQFYASMAAVLDDWLIIPLQKQIGAVVLPHVYHAWHARSIGTGYVLQPGGLMINPHQLLKDVGSVDGPVEVHLAEHWFRSGHPEVNPLDENLVSEDPLVVSAILVDEQRCHPDVEAALEAHDAAKRLPGVAATASKLTRIREAMRGQSSLYQGPVHVGPTLPEKSLASSKSVSRIIKRNQRRSKG